MTSPLAVNHKFVSLTVAEIWPIEIFQGQFHLVLTSQGHPKSNQFFVITPPIHLNEDVTPPSILSYHGYKYLVTHSLTD